MDIVVQRIKEQRAKLGITQQQLAFDTGMSIAGIQSIETGRAKPNIDTLLKLSDRFGCTTDYLLGKSDIEKPTVWTYLSKEEFLSNLRERLEQYKHEDDKKGILDMIEAVEKFHKDVE
jgi:transcriptional regulator with XRE-family HTH domain